MQCLDDDPIRLTEANAATSRRFGSAIATDGTSIIVGASAFRANGIDSGAVFVFEESHSALVHRLIACDAADGDWFGRSVAIGDGAVLVGAPFADHQGSAAGAAYLFDLVTGAQLCQFSPTDLVSDSLFGWSVALAGRIAVVSSPGDDDQGLNAGAVYLFDTSTGEQVAKLTADDAQGGEWSGLAVAADSRFVAVGSPYANGKADGSGAVYVFDVSTGTQFRKLMADDGVPGDNFGNAVSVDETMILVGARWDDDDGINSGSAYVFDLESGHQLHKLRADDGDGGDSFGIGVAIRGSVAVVGAHEGYFTAGSGYVFDLRTGRQPVKLIAPNATIGDHFGFGVAVRDDFVVIGAPDATDEDAAGAGTAYIFDVRTAMLRAQIHGGDPAEADRFGAAVALSPDGRTAIIGSPGDDLDAHNAGAAVLVDLQTGAQIARLAPDKPIPAAYFGEAVALDGEYAVVGAPFADDKCDDCGAAFVFNASTGEQIARLEPIGLVVAQAGQWPMFGWSVAIRNGLVAVGAPTSDDFGTDSGSVFLFDAATGRQVNKLTPAEAPHTGWFGWSIAMSEDLLVVGAPRISSLDTKGNILMYDTGAVYVFGLGSGEELSKLTLPQPVQFMALGFAVAISDEQILVSALHPMAPGAWPGSAHLFSQAGAHLLDLSADSISFDLFGESLALIDRFAIIGAPTADDYGFNSGSAYVFDIDSGAQLGEPRPLVDSPYDLFGESIAAGIHSVLIGSPGASLAGERSGAAYIFHVCSCPADLNNDNTVNVLDLLSMLSAWGPNPGHAADLTGDDVVNVLDLMQMLGAWGSCA